MRRKPRFMAWVMHERPYSLFASFASPLPDNSDGIPIEHGREKRDWPLMKNPVYTSRYGWWPMSFGDTATGRAGLEGLEKFLVRKAPDEYKEQLIWSLRHLWDEWGGKGHEDPMAQTFRQWIEQFEVEGDSRRGFYARHWRAVTPGRISSAQGVEAGLARHRTGLEEAGAADPAHESHQAYKSAVLALEIHPEMVKAYDERPDRPQPKQKAEATVHQFPGMGGESAVHASAAPTAQPTPGPMHVPAQPTAALVTPAGQYTSLYTTQQRFDRIERKLDEIRELLKVHIEVSGAVPGVDFAVPEILRGAGEPDLAQPYEQQSWPFDWERLFALADFTHADE